MNRPPIRVTHPEVLERIAKYAQHQLDSVAGPNVYGFVLLVIPTGVDGSNFGDYVSSVRQEDVPRLLREAANTMGGIAEGDHTNVHRA